ncbi:M3 family metallopeptidase [Microbulbifer bruguierae]|uniref:oligopeptidase A n=1 Tax=Microbulbifer bruguierae TaxID=3029061 RepID=A0ABY8NC00_9GAMM|nr:M3 family metallopeptidase [Microbulbifer bruguierae]WGL15317.1 M3 family metallopeptidase [Microbulbifer bruguierae]
MSDTLWSNPLLESHVLPPFDRIQPQFAEPAIVELVTKCREQLRSSMENAGEHPVWEETLAPLEEVQDKLGKAFNPVSHLNSVLSGDWRAPYEACLAKVTEYWTEVGQDPALYAVYRSLAKAPEFASWPQARQQAVRHGLRDMHLGGVSLQGAARERFATISKRLAELKSTFANNVLDATNAWTLNIEDESELAGIPQTALDSAKALAESKGKKGWLLTLDGPCFLAVMTHADNRDLRHQMSTAYITRASDVGPNGGEFDNTNVMAEILALRAEQAHLLGMKNYAERSLASKMARDPEEVENFLWDLAKRARPAAVREFAELQAFAAEQLDIEQLRPWDTAWAAEKLKQSRYAVSQEELRPYFPYPKVLQGLFAVAEKLFGVTAEEDPTIATYHPDVHFYWLKRGEEPIAGFYLDPYARENKRGGAWMDDARVRRQCVAGLQLPVAYLVCNFSSPTAAGASSLTAADARSSSKGTPALLTHYEVTTLFHEFGHGLHHMLTQVDVAAVSGINGVAWDAVELPSQFLENWCWEPEALAMISGHYQSGEPLPQALLDKMLAAKNFQSAMFTTRQLEFALFDFLLHSRPEGANGLEIQRLINEVREKVSVVPVSPENRFQHSFSHIFAGGYAAGYYSYKWAEVLSADAFSLFEEKGIFDSETGRKFLATVLEQGGSRDAQELFAEFRGRAPKIDALLRHSGIE